MRIFGIEREEVTDRKNCRRSFVISSLIIYYYGHKPKEHKSDGVCSMHRRDEKSKQKVNWKSSSRMAVTVLIIFHVYHSNILKPHGHKAKNV